MANIFVFGPLAHAALREILFGHTVASKPARLANHAVYRIDTPPFALLAPCPGSVAEGVMLYDASLTDMARLAFHAARPGYGLHRVRVETDAGPEAAQVWTADHSQLTPELPLWDLDDWAATWLDVTQVTLEDAMALFGTRPGAEVQGRWPQMMVRGASRLRAHEAVPTTTRHHAGPGDTRIANLRQPYANFFAVEEYDLSFRRFDGTPSPVITRAAFVSGDAVTVLPYDPVRDRVLVVEQFRAGPFARGDRQPWQIEAIAGRVDPGETPEQAARREAVEEAGLDLGRLVHVAGYYPSPGAKTEFLYSYVALTDLPDDAAGVFGLAEEAEDIRGHLLTFDQLMALVTSGEVGNAPLILTALWLQRERTSLRKPRGN